jgi:NAD(P)-dependent dehydrogenase (short-subunit alcohol dehydrogenase family)
VTLAVVTGASRGIGRAIAERLIADGHECLTTGRSDASARVGGADFYAVSFEDAVAVAAFAAFLEHLGPDILVNNAAINIPGRTEAFHVEDFDRLYAVNLRTPFALCQAVMSSMKRRSWGRIVNVTSLRSSIGKAGDAPFCATKFGLDGLTAALGAEGAPFNVLVNAVAPGYISTTSTERAFDPRECSSIARAIPAGRLGTVEEVAALVAWLVSQENTYMCGQNVMIDGGLSRSDTERWFASGGLAAAEPEPEPEPEPDLR